MCKGLKTDVISICVIHASTIHASLAVFGCLHGAMAALWSRIVSLDRHPQLQKVDGFVIFWLFDAAGVQTRRRRSIAALRGLKKLCACFPLAQNVMREVMRGVMREAAAGGPAA